jgi:hypothetical protein
VILSAALSSFLKIHVLSNVSDGFLAELGLLFIFAWAIGLVLAIMQAIRGQLFDWFRYWKEGIVLGPINVYPPITPAMQKESRVFTVGFCVLIAIAIISGFVPN